MRGQKAGHGHLFIRVPWIIGYTVADFIAGAQLVVGMSRAGDVAPPVICCVYVRRITIIHHAIGTVAGNLICVRCRIASIRAKYKAHVVTGNSVIRDQRIVHVNVQSVLSGVRIVNTYAAESRSGHLKVGIGVHHEEVRLTIGRLRDIRVLSPERRAIGHVDFDVFGLVGNHNLC